MGDKRVSSKQIISLSLLLFILNPVLVHSRKLACSPSPTPSKEEVIMRGSAPVACHSKCNQCMPCMPVEVLIRATELEDQGYYPQVWRCACRDQIFSP